MIEDLVKRVNHGLVQLQIPEMPSDEEQLEATTSRLLRQEGGTTRLDGDLLTIASMIVSICGIVVRLVPILRGNPAKAEDKVIEELVEETGDPNVAEDVRVKVIVEVAVNNAVTK